MQSAKSPAYMNSRRALPSPHISTSAAPSDWAWWIFWRMAGTRWDTSGENLSWRP